MSVRRQPSITDTIVCFQAELKQAEQSGPQTVGSCHSGKGLISERTFVHSGTLTGDKVSGTGHIQILGLNGIKT